MGDLADEIRAPYILLVGLLYRVCFLPHFELISVFQREPQLLSMASQDFEKHVNDLTDPISQAPSLPNDEDMHKLSDCMHTDIGFELYREALLMDPAEREAIARRVKMKLDCILMPMVW